jgi:hypothetical protein
MKEPLYWLIRGIAVGMLLLVIAHAIGLIGPL